MSSQAEDIIRETFSSLAKAIGVQIDIPDEMIANLAARLQAQIDLLAELQSAGRLLADDETRLTAEQVEDVEALVATANPYSAPAARLRALFPATEPAEPAASEGVNCGANSVVLGWCTLSAQHEGLHTNGTYFWGQAPDPAEPAEEETKAESRMDKHGVTVTGSPVVPAPTETEGGVIEVPDGRGIEVGEALKQIAAAQMAEVARKAETGPWLVVAEIPKGVACIRDREGDVWRRCGSGWEHGALHDPVDYSPFVAVKEEEA